MIDSNLRSTFQPFFDRIAKGFVLFKIKPNTITIFAFIIGVLASALISTGQIILPLIFLWLSGMLDVIDGTVARMTGLTSKVGAYMDLIFDRMVEATIILGFYFLLPQHALAYLLFFIAVLFNFTTFIVAGALFDNKGSKSMHYDVGIAERTETFIVFSLMILFQNDVLLILMIFNAIIFLTGLIRFTHILKSQRLDTQNEHIRKREAKFDHFNKNY